MQRHLLHRFALGLLLAGFGACASSPSRDVAAVRYGAEEVVVRIKNFNWSDVTVYLLNGTVRTRLGMVTSMGEAMFRLPAGLLASSTNVRLILDPIGSTVTFTTEPIFVQPGQTVEMNVENYLPLTNWAVW